MPKSSQPIEWSVGEEPFTQVSAAVRQQQEQQSASSAQSRKGTNFYQILIGLAAAFVLYMAASTYFLTPEPISNQNPDRSPPTVPIQESATEAQEMSALKQQTIQEILVLESSMAVGPQLYKLIDAQALANHDRAFVDSITGKTNGGEVDLAILGLQRREFLLDIKIAEPLAIATILVENPNDEQWHYGSYQERRFYQREGASWRWAAPAEYLQGPPQWIETVHLKFEFQELERDYFLAIADEMEAAHVRLRKIVDPSYSGKEFRPPEPSRLSTTDSPTSGEAKLTLVSVPRDVPGLIGGGARQKIASPLVGKRPTSFSNEEWLSQRIFERLVHLEVRKSVATEVGIGYHRWDQMGAALTGWLQYEILGRRSPWHAEAAEKFEPSIYTESPQPLTILFTTDPNGWPTRNERMQDYMLGETMIDYAVQTHGIGKVGDLLHGFSIYHTWAELIPAVYGVSVGEFEAGWNGYLRSHPKNGCVSNTCLSQTASPLDRSDSISGRAEESWPEKERQ